jgi:hypothetical protein
MEEKGKVGVRTCLHSMPSIPFSDSYISCFRLLDSVGFSSHLLFTRLSVDKQENPNKKKNKEGM